MTTQTKVMTTGREASWIVKGEEQHNSKSQHATPTTVPTWARKYPTRSGNHGWSSEQRWQKIAGVDSRSLREE